MSLLVNYSDSSDSGSDGDNDVVDDKETDNAAALTEHSTSSVAIKGAVEFKDGGLLLNDHLVSPPCAKKLKMCSDENVEKRESLPLPKAVVEMFNDDCDMCTDDGGHYLGRVRSFPHVRGNWPTYVYITVELTNEIAACVAEFMKSLEQHFSTPHTFHSIPTLSLHVSLSRTVVIPHHWIEPLMGSLRSKFTTQESFLMSFSDLAVYTNDDKTRSFIGLTVQSSTHDKLCSLVSLVDESFGDYKLPPFYQEPSFHVSLYWCLGNLLSSSTDVTMATLQHHWNTLLLNSSSDSPMTEGHVTCHVTDVRCKTGNKIFTFTLTGTHS